MEVSSVFNKLAESLGKKSFLKGNKLNKLSKSDITTLITQNIAMHTTCVNVLKSFSAAELNSWYQNKVVPALNSATGKSKSIYDTYAKGLNSNASGMERKCVLSSLASVNGKFIEILNTIVSKIDELFKDESIQIFDARVSHIAILGMIKDSTRVAMFTEFLYSYLIKIANGIGGDIPRYRENFMADNVSEVVKIVNRVLSHEGSYNIAKDIDNIKRHNADLVLGADGTNKGILKYVGTVKNFYTPGFVDSILSAISTLNIFDHFMNFIDDYKVARNKRNRETKEWLEGHVALLRMDLSELDPTSPEYTKLVNIIKAYDVKISEYDEEINAFENGE